MANFYAQYPSSSGGSNPSIGTNGITAPTSSTEVGGINPTGNLSPLQTNAAGSLITTPDPTGVQHVIVDSSALPSGAATAAAQASQLSQETASAASLVSIDGKQSNISTNTSNTAVNTTTIATNTGNTATSVASIDTKTPTVGQKAMAASTPVVIASNQTSIPVAATIQAGSAIIGQVSIDQTTPGTTNGVQVNAALPVGTNSIGQVTANAGTNLNTSTLAVESGGNLAGLNAKFGSLGQKAMSGSAPVTIASDQASIPITQPDATASGSITIINSNPNSGAATAGSTVAVTSLNGQTSWSVQVTGVYTGALTPQVTVDGSNWIALSATAVTNVNTNAQAASIASASVGIFEISAPPCAQLRITALAAMTGTAVVTVRVSSSTTRVGLDSPIPAGAAIIGSLAANQSSNVAQINGVAPLMGNGVTGTGSLRVTLASDTSTNTNPLLTNQKGLTFSNTPITLTYSVGSPVTTAAYTQLIASTTSATTWIDIFDSSGQGMILATGAAASEVVAAYIPPGGDSFSYAIPASTRVSIKALSANATSGYILLNLRG